VIDQLTITAVEPAAAAAVLSATDDSIVLSGTVGSDAAADQLRAIAAEVYSPAQITDELEIVDGAEPATVTVRGILTDTTTAVALREALDGLDGLDAELVDELVVDADASEEINAILALEPILFQSATAIILPDSQPTLEEAARILQLFPEAQVEIGGHTDSLGPEEANRVLSENRAQAVLQSLRDLGVTNELTAVGYGESQLKFPDDKGDTPDKIEARQANRRIEFRTLN
jgi:outer membrane protein OmpA-like peptidoglycan-associated protein